MADARTAPLPHAVVRARTTRRLSRPADAAAGRGPVDVAALYEELAPAVLGYLRSQRVTDPEDVLGEVFMHVARDIHRFRGPPDACRRWVFTIAHHRLVDDRRRRSVRPRSVDGAVPEAPDPTVPPDPFDPVLVSALGRLTPAQREVVVLRFVADLAVRDVARITRRRPGAVKALQARGIEQLQRFLDPS
ncbi:hypothetical protein BH24ACT3_BH24ACT3_17420 [soil metagenome]